MKKTPVYAAMQQFFSSNSSPNYSVEFYTLGAT